MCKNSMTHMMIKRRLFDGYLRQRSLRSRPICRNTAARSLRSSPFGRNCGGIRCKGIRCIPRGSHAPFPVGLCRAAPFVGVGAAPARVLGEEQDRKVAALVVLPPILQRLTPKRFSITLSTPLPVSSFPLAPRCLVCRNCGTFCRRGLSRANLSVVRR